MHYLVINFSNDFFAQSKVCDHLSYFPVSFPTIAWIKFLAPNAVHPNTSSHLRKFGITKFCVYSHHTPKADGSDMTFILLLFASAQEEPTRLCGPLDLPHTLQKNRRAHPKCMNNQTWMETTSLHIKFCSDGNANLIRVVCHSVGALIVRVWNAFAMACFFGGYVW